MTILEGSLSFFYRSGRQEDIISPLLMGKATGLDFNSNGLNLGDEEISIFKVLEVVLLTSI